MSGSSIDVEVVVVGGGLAGLSAARSQADAGRSVVVLEARDRAFGEQDLRSEEWTRGCPSAYMSTSGWLQFGPAIRRPAGRVHWAGSELAPVWCTWMDDAIASGETTAGEVNDLLDLPGQRGHEPGHPEAGPAPSEALKAPVDCPQLMRNGAIMFVLFAAVLTSADRLWVQLDVLAYPGAGPGDQAWWAPLLLGTASLIFVALHRILARRILLNRDPPIPPGRTATSSSFGLVLSGAPRHGGRGCARRARQNGICRRQPDWCSAVVAWRLAQRRPVRASCLAAVVR